MAIVKRKGVRRRTSNSAGESENRQEANSESKPEEKKSKSTPKKSTSPKPRAKSGIFKGKVYAVKSSYSLRSGFKGIGMDASSDVVDPKRKGKEKVSDDSETETDSDEVCKKMKLEKDNDDDKDDDNDDDGGGDGGLAHKNLTNVGQALVVGN